MTVELPPPPPTVTIDEANSVVIVEDDAGRRALPMDSAEAFAAVSRAWIRCGWDTKYVYSFTWQGRPIIQLPEDMFRLQEVIYSVRPDVILETGVAHGGSLIFHAGVCQNMGKGRVIGVDIEIRPHNRAAIEAHKLFPYITLIEGNAVAPETVQSVKNLIKPGETCILILDSNHRRDHVLAEMRAYGDLVTPGSYIVACDGIMAQVVGAPRTEPDWDTDNPITAVQQFLAENKDFVAEEPAFAFNEGAVDQRVTYWPHAYLKRVAAS